MIFQTRPQVAQEQKQCAERIDRLTRFINGPKWIEADRPERTRLLRQLQIEEQLDHVLLERLQDVNQPPRSTP